MLYAGRLDREFVLVVEEDLLLLATTRSVLRQNGYEVVASSSPEEALIFCQERSGARVALCDVVYPHSRMTGIDLARRLQALTGARTILTCEYDRLMLNHISGFDSYPFLPQPVSAQQLMSAVKEAWQVPGQARERIA